MFHINKKGDVKKCRAKKKKCPFQEHYETFEKAQEAYSKESEKSVLPTLDKEFNKLIKELKPYSDWGEEIKDFISQNPTVKLEKFNKKSASDQIINFMSLNMGSGFKRTQLSKLGLILANKNDGDSIQWVNKIDRKGLTLYKAKQGKDLFYGLKDLTFTDKYLFNRIDLTNKKEKKLSEENSRKFFKSLSESKFEIGHKDPRKALSKENMVMQPYEINRSNRDNYIFDDRGLPKAPNPNKLAENPELFYSKDDLEFLAKNLDLTKYLK